MKAISRILPILAIFVFLSCKTQTIAPLIETATADVRGSIDLYGDQGGLIPPYSGINISIDGTGISATTNDTGYYEIKNVPGGTYNFTLSKPGFGTVRWFGVSIQGGGNVPVNINQNTGNYPYPTRLYKNSDLAVTMQSATMIGSTLQIQGSYRDTDLDLPYPQAAMYFSRKSSVSPIPGHYDFVYSTIVYGEYLGAPTFFDSSNSSFQIPLTSEVLNLFGYNSGDSVYIAVYGEPFYGGYFQSDYDWEVCADYYDPTTGQQVLTSVNSTPSPVIGFKIP